MKVQIQILVVFLVTDKFLMIEALRFRVKWRQLVPFLRQLLVLFVGLCLVLWLLTCSLSQICSFTNNVDVEDSSSC